MSDSLQLHGLHSPWNSPGQNTRADSLSLLRGIFPTQGWNPGLPHCGRILYQLSHQGSATVLEWVACPFSRGNLAHPGIQAGSPALQADSLPTELSGKTNSEKCYAAFTNLKSFQTPENKAEHHKYCNTGTYT